MNVSMQLLSTTSFESVFRIYNDGARDDTVSFDASCCLKGLWISPEKVRHAGS